MICDIKAHAGEALPILFHMSSEMPALQIVIFQIYIAKWRLSYLTETNCYYLETGAYSYITHPHLKHYH